MPVYDWDATTGKRYSLLFAELMRPDFPRGIVVHYFAYNVRSGTTVTKDLDTTLGRCECECSTGKEEEELEHGLP